MPTPTEPAEVVLVTGGRGFIGRRLVKLLAAKGRVISLDITPVPEDDRPGVLELSLDVADAGAVREVLGAYRIGEIYDLASFAVAGLPKEDYVVNGRMTEAMTSAVADLRSVQYTFFSTQFVFRTPDKVPEGEDDYAPVDHYGESKIGSETMVRARLPRDRWRIARPTYVWGPGSQRFRDGLLRRLRARQLLIPSDRDLKRFYGYVDTVAAQAISLTRSQSGDQRVFYVSDPALPLAEFCAHLVHALGCGGALAVPSPLIRLLGQAGGLAERAHLPFPINPIQAREMTTNYPVPITPTIEVTGIVTSYPEAAVETVRQANFGGR